VPAVVAVWHRLKVTRRRFGSCRWLPNSTRKHATAERLFRDRNGHVEET
jgi:hypothetical protein